jgi:hypothetical protein
MNTIRIRKAALAALVALTLAAGAYAPTRQLAGDPSQWGRAAKVNEYEGQHRITGDPSQWEVAKKGSFDITELDGESVAKVNEYEGQHRIALNFSKIKIEY